MKRKSQRIGVLRGIRHLLPCLLVALATATVATAEDLTIATFNAEFLTRPKVHVRFGLPLNLSGPDAQTWAAPGFRDQKFNEASKAVAGYLATLDADVLALTEVGDATDIAELKQELTALGVTYAHSAVCDCTDNTTKQHVAVLSRFPLLEVLPAIPGREGYYEELDDAEAESDTGISKGLRVRLQAAGQTFTLYVVHLASERGGHEQDAQRIAQASIVRRHYLPLLTTGEHVIVAGDLNDYRGEPALRRIRGLDDMWEDLIQTGAVKYFPSGKEGTRWTYEFEGVRQQIDHVLLSGSIKQAAKSIKTEVRDQDNPLVSDHRPLVVTLEFE